MGKFRNQRKSNKSKKIKKSKNQKSRRIKKMKGGDGHNGEDCPICLTNVIDDNYSRQIWHCTHLICSPCENAWLVNTPRLSCPICRAARRGHISSPPGQQLMVRFRRGLNAMFERGTGIRLRITNNNERGLFYGIMLGPIYILSGVVSGIILVSIIANMNQNGGGAGTTNNIKKIDNVVLDDLLYIRSFNKIFTDNNLDISKINELTIQTNIPYDEEKVNQMNLKLKELTYL